MTLRELINQITANAPLSKYLSQFQELDYEFRILHNSMENINMPFVIEEVKILRNLKQISFLVE